MAASTETLETRVPADDMNGSQTSSKINFVEKYAEERNKRLGKGLSQYVDLRTSEKLKHFLDDLWIESGTPVKQVVQDRGHKKFLIVGAGWAGIMMAVNLIKVGFSADDMVIVDPAGGFGGTWYWNRFPGINCDVESYIYLPLLEEMGYMPTAKYVDGEEIRIYAERICRKYDLVKAGMFQSSVKQMIWDSNKQRWKVVIDQAPKGLLGIRINATADFVYLASGMLNNAKVPNIVDTDRFEGQMFHTARWDYSVTGGTFTGPEMTKLRDKTVGVIGTGATCVQAVPQLAKWAKQLLLFQRTPSSVDARDNKETDPKTWKTEIASKLGWQRERNINYCRWLSNAEEKPDVDLVADGWTRMPSFCALGGGPYEVTLENVQSYVAHLHGLDLPHQVRVRSRVEEVVKDPKTAKALQAWYNGWCKRPCFHDEYLTAFNRPNVSLIDTDGRGVDGMTSRGVKVGDNEYEVDVLVLATGFQFPVAGTAASRANIDLVGVEGESLDEKFKRGVATLHGVTTRGFPNLFWTGGSQSGGSPNYMFVIDVVTEHVAYLIAEAHKKQGATPVIQPTTEAEEEWTMRVMSQAAAFAAVQGCTPGYFNMEGEADRIPPEQQMIAGRAAPWARGIEDYLHVLEAWRADGTMQGLEITPQS